MAGLNPLKIGTGAGATILGLYLLFNNNQNVLGVIVGVIAIALGIGLVASVK